MKQGIIKPNDLLAFMSDEQYIQFIASIKSKHNILDEEPLWIIAEWSEK